MTVEPAIFTCSICAEPSTDICAYCTKDACGNHRCERCKRCSDCCECDVPLSAAEVVPEPAAAAPPIFEPEAAPEPAIEMDGEEMGEAENAISDPDLTAIFEAESPAASEHQPDESPLI